MALGCSSPSKSTSNITENNQSTNEKTKTSLSPTNSPSTNSISSEKSIGENNDTKKNKDSKSSTVKNKTSKDSETSSQSTTPSNEAEKREYGVTKLISFVLPVGWEIVPDGYDSPYTYLYRDYVTIKKGEASISIDVTLDSYPVGIGGDPYIEDTYTYGDFWYEALRNVLDYGNSTGNIVVDETNLSLDAGGYLGYVFNDYGIMTVTYTNPNGAYADDPDLTSLLNSLEVKDSYGGVKILADSINIRYGNSVDAEKVGIAKKGEKYKVRAISQDENYTWYAIGFKDGDPNGGSLLWIADKDGKWIKFKEN